MIYGNFRKRISPVVRLFAALALVVGLVLPTALASAASAASGQRTATFTAVANEFGVPANLLLAVSYNESRWTPHGDTPSSDNGYGLMDLRTKTVAVVEDGRGDAKRPVSQQGEITATHYTLDDAAKLLGVASGTLKTDERQNIRGAAAVLASYAKQHNNGQLPASVNGWYSALVDYSGSTGEAATLFADHVYATIQTGASLHTGDGQDLYLSADASVSPLHVNTALPNALSAPAVPQLNAAGNTDCPATLNCRFIPAGYAANSSDPADYGNYDPADRPHDMKIKYIVIHDTEGSYESAISHFQDTHSYVSCNYIIRSSDGAVTEMVRPTDVSWCAGDWYVNMHSINIEHEGVATQGATWYTEEMYKSSATLVKYLAQKYDIPLDRQHIIGHGDVPTLSPGRMAGQHWDPGPYWDWNHYMDLLHAPTTNGPAVTQSTKLVTIAPNFATNQPVIMQPLSDCPTDDCAPLPAQGSNRVYLHSAPSMAAPLLSDPYLHTGGEPGTNHADDWSATVEAGDSYAMADKQGDWTAIWYGGKKGWFYNPGGAGHTAHVSHGQALTPKQGLASIAVYGGAYPESSAYPATIPDQSLTPLYQLPAGQTYVSAGKVPTDYFYDATIDFSLPDDHMIVKGNEKYYQITFNHKQAYVKAADVQVKSY
ncbi:MAG TPA: N-acetylmuramoyl-L-alanine amidase [Patescibacteria group bacterium]|nr:N-acetylmuramoyl-L-alanine amidase [Patescibacteria group bacterium]